MAVRDTNLIYGINTTAGFTDLIDPAAALNTLGLDPDDLARIGNVADLINVNQFHHLSGVSGSPNEPLPENLIERISKFSRATQFLQHQFEDTAGATFTGTTRNTESIQGNLLINGPVAAPAIRFHSTELLNSTTGEFEPLDISTSRVSSWSRTGSTISFGGDLKIANLSPAHGATIGAPSNGLSSMVNQGLPVVLPNETPHISAGKIIVDGRTQQTKITPRTFNAEQATHKIKVRVNDEDVYMYAMKNIPLSFTGTFGARLIVGTFKAPTAPNSTDYRVFDGNIVTDVFTDSYTGFFSGALFEDALVYRRFGYGRKTFEVYQVPGFISEITINDLNIEDFPNADYSSLVTLNARGNLFNVFPNFVKISPLLTSLDFRGCKFGNSPQNSDKNLNRITDSLLSRIPVGITTLKLANAFGGPNGSDFNAISTNDFKRKFLSMNEFSFCEQSFISSFDSPSLPEIPKNTSTYTFEETGARMMAGSSQTKSVSLGGTANAYVHSITGTPTKPARISIRRSLTNFKVDLNSPNSPGAGYNSDVFTIPVDHTTTSTGAGSPNGIPYGNIKVHIDSGAVSSARFEPYHTVEEWNLIPNQEHKFPNGVQHTRIPHVPSSGYSPMGYYVDCGMFSSPMSLTRYSFYKTKFLVSDKFHAYMNPFGEHNATGASNQGFGNTSISGGTQTGSSVNNVGFHDVYKNISNFNIAESQLPVPNFANNTVLTTFNALNHLQKPYADVIDDVTKYKKIGTQAGINTPTLWEHNIMYTIYDSPSRTSETDLTGNAQPGTLGSYKFKNCSKLTTMNFNNSEIGGTIPIFEGNTKLYSVDFSNTFFNRTQPSSFTGSAVNSPVIFPITQWLACKDTMYSFKFKRGDGGGGTERPAFNLDPRGEYSTALEDHDNGWARLPMQRLREVNALTGPGSGQVESVAGTYTNALQVGDFPTDLFGDKLNDFSFTGRNQSANKEYRGDPDRGGLAYAIPTFKNASNLKTMDFRANSLGPDRRGPHSKDSPGKLHHWTGHWNPKLEKIFLHVNRLQGRLSFHRLANLSPNEFGYDPANSNKALEQLNELRLDWNFLQKIDDWGLPGDAIYSKFARLEATAAFDCPSYGHGWPNHNQQKLLDLHGSDETVASQYDLVGHGRYGFSHNPNKEGTSKPYRADGRARFLLDRRKDGTADKYEFPIPNMSGRLPALRSLNLRDHVGTKQGGPFTRFAMPGDYTLFHGMNNLRYINVVGNGFTRESVIDTCRCLLSWCNWYKSTYNKTMAWMRNPTYGASGRLNVQFGYQRGWDSPLDGTRVIANGDTYKYVPYDGVGQSSTSSGNDHSILKYTPPTDFDNTGKMDFRILQPSLSLEEFHPDSLYRAPHADVTKHEFPTLEDNDLLKELTEDWGVTIGGVLFSSVPDAPQAPDIDVSLTGTTFDKLHADRKNGNRYNLYQWGLGPIRATISLGPPGGIPIDSFATTQLRVFIIDWQGIESEVLTDVNGTLLTDRWNAFSDANALVAGGNSIGTVPTSDTFDFNFSLLPTGNPPTSTLNPQFGNAPNDLATVQPEGTTDFANAKQTITVKVTVEGLRPGIATRTQTLEFINMKETRTSAETSLPHDSGEWKWLVSG